MKEFNPLQMLVGSITEAAEVVQPVAQKVERTKSILVYTKNTMVERAIRAINRKAAKASWNYRRLRMA